MTDAMFFAVQPGRIPRDDTPTDVEALLAEQTPQGVWRRRLSIREIEALMAHWDLTRRWEHGNIDGTVSE